MSSSRKYVVDDEWNTYCLHYSRYPISIIVLQQLIVDNDATWE